MNCWLQKSLLEGLKVRFKFQRGHFKGDSFLNLLIVMDLKKNVTLKIK